MFPSVGTLAAVVPSNGSGLLAMFDALQFFGKAQGKVGLVLGDSQRLLICPLVSGKAMVSPLLLSRGDDLEWPVHPLLLAFMFPQECVYPWDEFKDSMGFTSRGFGPTTRHCLLSATSRTRSLSRPHLAASKARNLFSVAWHLSSSCSLSNCWSQSVLDAL